jgi:DNA-binding NarL/FixJ family response regulator
VRKITYYILGNRPSRRHVFPDCQNVGVLVVDDQAIVREAISSTLDCEPSFSVKQAGSLADARAMLGGVDIAILDLGLPDGDGADLIAELKEVNPAAKTIVLTSSIDSADIHRALQRGAAAVLNKLDGLDDVLTTVKRLERLTN